MRPLDHGTSAVGHLGRRCLSHAQQIPFRRKRLCAVSFSACLTASAWLSSTGISLPAAKPSFPSGCLAPKNTIATGYCCVLAAHFPLRLPCRKHRPFAHGHALRAARRPCCTGMRQALGRLRPAEETTHLPEKAGASAQAARKSEERADCTGSASSETRKSDRACSAALLCCGPVYQA